MFSSTTFDSVGFSSVSEDVKTSSNASLQTSEIVLADKGEQFRHLCDKNVQGAPDIETKQAKYDENKLLNFLNRVTGPLLKELDKSERSKAFTVKRLNTDNGLSGQEVQELYVLSGHPPPGINQDARVSSLSWSCTGNVIAVGFESNTHEGWCTHESLVNFYNISSSKFDGKTPTNSIKTDSCVTSVAMHPHEPSIVALGTHSGNIELWSIGKDNRSDGVCMSKEQYHEDKVTQISWANDSTQQLILVTSSLDGRMNILKNTSIGNTQLVEKYVLHPESPDVLKPGVTCFSFCIQQPGTFVTALESGQLLLCSTFAISKKRDSSTVERSPVLRPLDKKTGPIINIKFSPHEEHVFLITSLDFKITLYSIQQDGPLLNIYSEFDIIGADWNLEQAKCIIAWGISSKLQVYNQETGDKIAELIPDDSLTKNRKYYQALFNAKSTKLIALAGNDGNSYIWTIPTFYRT